MKYRKAVFIVAYSETREKEVEFLILKRKLHWHGWEFPKGGVEKGETQLQAARRELHEETGLKPIGKIKRFRFSGKYKYGKIFADRPGFIGQTFTLYAARVESGARAKIKLDPKEHSGHKWVSYKAALKKLKWPNQKKSLKLVGAWLKQSKRD